MPLQLPSLTGGTAAAPHVLLGQLQIFLKDVMAEDALTTEEIKRVHRPTKTTLALVTTQDPSDWRCLPPTP